MINQEEKQNVSKSSNFKTKAMSISPEFFNKMIWHTIKQYKYKIRTSVQELISNAQDAQVENGNPQTPLKIQLPTKLETTFKLRDYGTGMTPEVVNNIYCNMGASGSSYTDAKKGGFGIGGKSPLGFCDQYNIKTFVNGTYWLYVIYKNEVNGINVDMLDTGLTDEPNGTEVQIPVKRDEVEQFVKAASRATMFWDVQPIFNLPSEERFIVKGGLKITDKIALYDDKELSNMFTSNRYNYNYSSKGIIILVDGIPYELDNDFIKGSMSEVYDMVKDRCLVLKVNVGDVKVLQTRESLEQCKKTEDFLEKLGLEVKSELNNFIQESVNKDTLMQAIEAQKTLRKYFKDSVEMSYEKFTIRYDRVHFPQKLVKASNGVNKNANMFELVEYHFRSSRYRQTLQNAARLSQKVSSLPFEELDKIYFDDLPNEHLNKKARRLKYSIQHTKDNVYFLTNVPSDVRKMISKHFTLKGVSTLPMPPKSASKRGTGVTSVLSNEVMIHHWGNYGTWHTKTKYTINLNTNKTRYIYVSSGQDISLRWRKFIVSRGFTPCMIGKKYHKTLTDSFISFDDYKKNLVLSQTEKLAIISDSIYWDIGEIEAIKAAKKSNDIELRKIGKSLTLPRLRNFTYPVELSDLIISSNDSFIKNIILNKKKLKARIKSRYNINISRSNYHKDVLANIINIKNTNLNKFKGL